MAFKDTSNKPAVPAIAGEHTAGGDGVVGKGRRGVVGDSKDFQGVFGHSVSNAGVVGDADAFHGVFGVSHGVHSAGVFGVNQSAGGMGVAGVAEHGQGVGVSGESPHIGVRGTGRQGVVGYSRDYQGVFGHSEANAGVVGESQAFHAVFGISHGANSGGIFGANDGGGWAGVFDGRVSVSKDLEVHGDIKMMNADVAEEFEVGSASDIAPGTVVVLTDDGRVVESTVASDRRVVGVVSGGGNYRPAIILDRSESGLRRPVALMGKVACRTDASYGAIQVGDLLTTSPTAGAAMRVQSLHGSAGAVIGKALAPLRSGIGMIPILVTLQ